MTGQAAGKLSTEELHCLLDHLRTYIESGEAVVMPRIGPSDSCGNPIYLDGAAFLSGFAAFLKAQKLDAEKEISRLSLAMELSTYVRCGGTKKMVYRLEKGVSKITPDFFDVLANKLCYELIEGKLHPARQATDAFLFQRLKEVNEADESRVQALIAEIDDILLVLARKLEEASLAAISTAGNGREAKSP
jgi:hypothetical protein